MLTLVLNLLLKVVTSNAAETLIAMGINKLLAHPKSGIGKDLALTMVDAIAKSKANPTTADVFQDARQLLTFG